MKYYNPKNIPIPLEEWQDEEYDINSENFIAATDTKFHIKSWDGADVSQAKCKNCGGVNFEVGLARHYTVVKCVNCEYEVCVHEG